MITWITTVGWSPFAVINPIWAYCKENDDCPNKIILIYTPLERIKSNLKVCTRYISEIIKTYNGNKLAKDFIIIEEIKNDSIEVYAEKLNTIIEREKNLKTEKLILDMTPGRKYMSAINVYYGYNLSEIPIQVFYLHLEESKYQDIPFPLTPITKNELIDILESTELFSTSSKSFQKEASDFIFKDEDLKKEYLILSAIESEFNTKTKVRKYLFGYKISLLGHELDKLLQGLIIRNLIDQKPVIKNNQKYILYSLTSKAKTFLNDLRLKLTTNKGEGE